MTNAPRIYYLNSSIADSEDALTAQVNACSAAGFTHLMLACSSTTVAATVGLIGRAAGNANMGLLLDIAFVAQAAANAGAPPDPRRIETLTALSSGPDPRDAAEASSNGTHEVDWHARLAAWLAQGAAGFSCRGLEAHGGEFWRTLIAKARQVQPQTCFIAWTPGCSAEHLAGLVGCGFDATIASTPWWDYRSAWLAEESVRLAQVAPPIALVDDPLAARSMAWHGAADPDDVRRRCERALGMAAVSGCGWLMPMGFESGLGGDAPTAAVEQAGVAANSALQGGALPAIIARANALVATLALRADTGTGALVAVDSGSSGITVLLRHAAPGLADSAGAVVIVVNPDVQKPQHLALGSIARELGKLVVHERLWPAASPCEPAAVITLENAGLQLLAARELAPVVHFVNRGKRTAQAACAAPRVAIEAITPAVDDGRFPVKRTVGEQVEVEADVFMDGHDKLGVMLLWRPANQKHWHEVPMAPLGNDRWRAVLPLQRVGRHVYAIQAWRDAFATYRDELSKKNAAGLDVTLELEEGRRMIVAAASHAATRGRGEVAATLEAFAGRLEQPSAKPGRAASANTNAVAKAKAKADANANANANAGRAPLVAEMLSDAIAGAMQQADDRPFGVITEPPRAIDAERLAARFSSWYELFPRSQSGDTGLHGSFADVEKRLPAIRDMGFDTLYFPPIHPIGARNRKGRNNSLTPTADDPGSPYAIGAADGGHDALHAELGTLEDFRHLCTAAHDHGLEIALDFAIQCSPDHPWIKAHPDWFAWRPDGSMRYAENPPKKYEDIVNVDFYAAGAMPALWIALRDAVLFWVTQGVRVFRVDNPHTKPLPFWEWMIGDIRSRYPDTLFLSEAFTRPKVMYRLAKVGFSQSYTYFTWRHTKQEFTEYMTELTTTGVQDYFRPNFFVNTPDINPVFLQQSGRPGFLIRAALATLLSGLWGMYSGFELCEATPVPGKEDYLDSEKYEIRAWDWQRPGNIIAEITLLNRIRRAHPALQSHLGVQFCESSDPNMLCFLRYVRPPAGTAGLGGDVLFVAINLDPSGAHQTSVRLPLWQLGLPDDGVLPVEDLLHGNRFTLHGRDQQLRLDPNSLPYVVWRLTPAVQFQGV